MGGARRILLRALADVLAYVIAQVINRRHMYLARLGVDGDDAIPGQHPGLQLRCHAGGIGLHQGLGRAISGQGIGQVRFGIGTAIVRRHQHQRTCLVEFAKFTCQGVAGQAGAENEQWFHEADSSGCVGGWSAFGLRR